MALLILHKHFIMYHDTALQTVQIKKNGPDQKGVRFNYEPDHKPGSCVQELYLFMKYLNVFIAPYLSSLYNGFPIEWIRFIETISTLTLLVLITSNKQTAEKS